MLKLKWTILVMVLSITVRQSVAQDFSGYYRSPMDIPLILSANFAETRSNHFHSGIDIKTAGAEGKPIYAVADGFISRIGIAPNGFGNTLYIAHPNGTTTVYAHLQKFSPEIARNVDEERHRQKKHNVDLYLNGYKFPVRKGDLIAWSGNTGSSAGPHLHFEVRETASQKPLNVLTKKVYDIRDDIPPTIVKLYYIELDTVNNVPLNSRPRAVEVRKLSDRLYAPADTTALEVGRSGYFILEVTDRKNNTHNTMGVYRVSALLDGEETFSFSLDGFLFSDTRYVNSLCHYSLQRGSRNQLIRLARQQANRLPAYGKLVNRGALVLNDHNRHKYSVIAEDDNGNKSEITLMVRRREAERKFHTEKDTTGIPVDAGQPFNRTNGGLNVSIKANSLYESIFYRQTESKAGSLNASAAKLVPVYSPLYSIHDPNIPLHTAMTISIKAAEVPPGISGKLCLAVLSRDGSTLSYSGGTYSDGRVSGDVRIFGTYCVVADTIPPVVTPSFTDGQDLSGSRSISFTLKDNFSGIASYTATIDGKWIPFEQTVGARTITHFFDPGRIDYNGSQHELILTVTDNKGNRTVVKRKFTK